MIRSPQRRRFAIGAAGLGLAAAMPAWLATAQAQSVDEIKKKGELTVGLLVDFPPYGTVNSNNEPDGYDADVAACSPRTGASSSSSFRSPARTGSRSSSPTRSIS